MTAQEPTPEMDILVKCKREGSPSTQEFQVYLRQSQQQQVPVVGFHVELRQAFLAETPQGGESSLGTTQAPCITLSFLPSLYCL